MGAFGNEARSAANRGAWLTLDNGDVCEAQIVKIGQVYDKTWPAKPATATAAAQPERVEKRIAMTLNVRSIKRPADMEPERIEDLREWDPKCGAIVELLDLSDALEAREGEFAIMQHQLRIVRADVPAAQFKATHYKVIDLGLAGSAPAATPQPHVAPNAQNGAQPQPGGGDLMAQIAQIAQASGLAALKAATAVAWYTATPLGRTGEVLAANAMRKQAILQAAILREPTVDALDALWETVIKPETAKDAKLQVALYSALTMRKAAFGGEDLPF